jgi:phosphotransferase system enzyme I (PtsI)
MQAEMLQLTGMPAAPGLAAGPLVRVSAAQRRIRQRGSPAAERAALEKAVHAAGEDLAALAVATAGDAEEGIVAFQLALMEDEELARPAYAAIDAGEAAEVAWELALDAQVADYESSGDEYFRGRAADLRDLRDRVLDILLGGVHEKIPPGAIVVADDLAPSAFLSTDWQSGGLVLNRGGVTSHVAILARARGVPMIVGVDVAQLAGHSQALLDAQKGVLILDPDASTRTAFDRRLSAYATRLASHTKYLGAEAKTASGKRVRVMINVASPEELDAIDPAHTDGIGLVRTELLFHRRDRLPDEEEQYRVYRRIVEWADGRPVTIRTLDAGGDKPIPGVTRDGESNPFLGVRGVRLSLRHPEVLSVQLRALARAAAAGNLKIMIPMVTVPDELYRCRALLAHAISELTAAGVTCERPALGMMVEVPAAALAIEEFDADFYSIGSNDLIQYLAAASRDEPELAALSQPGTAFWRVIGAITEHGRRTGREVSLCGDLASDTRQVPVLIECGLRALSVAPAALAAVKAAIAQS